MKKYKYNIINFKYLKNKDKQNVIDYLKYNGASRFDNDDAEGLLALIENLSDSNQNGFVVSYMIERICKEFDVLKIGDSSIVNVEIKLSNRADKIEQARQNYKLLKQKYTEYDINVYSYVKNGNKIFKYNPSSDNLEESNSDELNSDLSKIVHYEMPDINIDIKSVYKDPKFFLESQYILSKSQEDIKNKILKKKAGVFAVSGCGGTGKSLLALDIYKTLKTDKKVIFVAPFAKDRIIDSSLLKSVNFRMAAYFPLDSEQYDVVIIDEAQRLGKKHLEKIREVCKYLILFYDECQDVDDINQIEDFIKEISNDLEKAKINQVIRNDSSIDRYARKICGLRKSSLEDKKFDPTKIEIYMYDEFLKKRSEFKYYKMISPTKSKISSYPSCIKNCQEQTCEYLKNKIISDIVHFEIGREYDKVLIYLCKGYCVENGRISNKLQVCYGNVQKQLYTIISRVIEKAVFVCDDIEIYNFLSKCVDDLDK